MRLALLAVVLSGCCLNADRINAAGLQRDAELALKSSGLAVAGLRCSMYPGTRAGWCEGTAAAKDVEAFSLARKLVEDSKLHPQQCAALKGRASVRAWLPASGSDTSLGGPHLVMVWIDPASGTVCFEAAYRYG